MQNRFLKKVGKYRRDEFEDDDLGMNHYKQGIRSMRRGDIDKCLKSMIVSASQYNISDAWFFLGMFFVS